MIGHKKWEEALKNLARNDKLGHGFIFFGPDGVGKKTFALALANYLETGEFGEASGLCTDLKIVEPEGKTIGINEARGVREFLSQTPLRSPKKTIIIDRAHQLTTQAQNALLKTIEEPPEHSLIILVARDYELLLPTLTSRLPRMYFGPLTLGEVASWLEKSGVESARAKVLAKRSRGAPGVAWGYEFDEKIQEDYKVASKLYGATGTDLRGLLKDLVADEEFDVLAILDALIVLAGEEKKINSRFMQVALTMRREAATFNLNPRLQLDYLMSLAR